MTPPYDLAGDVRRFSQRHTAFQRAKWDPTSAAYGRRAASVEEMAGPGKPGYGREDFALRAGAWAVADSGGERAQPRPPAPHMGAVQHDAAQRYEADDWGALTRHLKSAARLYGASLVGVTRVNPLWVYACNGEEEPVELPRGVNTAVVMAIAMDYDLIRTSPSVGSAAATGNGYSRMAFTAACVARYLVELGWRAIPSGNDTALSIPLAIDAGLGELGRNGLLVTVPHGPRVRLCKVFTDAPLVPDEAISFGVREFCNVCVKCAQTCPSGSICHGEMTAAGPTPSNNPGVLKWYINPDTCLAFWRTNGVGCANCIRSCPFNKREGWLHDVTRAFIRARSHLMDRVMVFLDDLCGYGRQIETPTVDSSRILRG